MQGNPARNANESAPGARANDWPDFLAVEEPRERIAAGTGEFVDDHYLWSVNGYWWPRSIFPFARGESREKFAAKLFRIEIRNLSTGIVAFIDDHAVLIELRGELLVERDDAREGRVRHVHIADAPAGGLRDFAAVFLPPIEVKRTRFPLSWLYPDFPCTLWGGLGIEFQRDGVSRPGLEIG